MDASIGKYLKSPQPVGSLIRLLSCWSPTQSPVQLDIVPLRGLHTCVALWSEERHLRWARPCSQGNLAPVPALVDALRRGWGKGVGDDGRTQRGGGGRRGLVGEEDGPSEATEPSLALRAASA